VEPADIDNIEFKTTRVKEGYDQDEVDAFLDEINIAWAQDRKLLDGQQSELVRLRRQLSEAQAIADAYDVTAPIPVVSPAESATRILEYAQRTADQVMSEAKNDADNLKAATENESAEILGRARAQAESIMNEARGTVYQLDQEAKALTTKVKDTKEYVRGYLRRALNELEESGG
jgi:DivIVA domain-containing protein